MAKGKATDFIGRNRKPRVHIEYSVDKGNATKKINIPFVMGVMADLSGKPDAENPLPRLDKREFLDLDIDNFDARLKAMKPRVAFDVPNKLTGGSNLKVDITFESMDDFSPAAVAKKVGALGKLLETRTQLSNLVNVYMDGKAEAEEMIADLLGDDLKSLLPAREEAPQEEAPQAESEPKEPEE